MPSQVEEAILHGGCEAMAAGKAVLASGKGKLANLWWKWHNRLSPRRAYVERQYSMILTVRLLIEERRRLPKNLHGVFQNTVGKM